MGPRAHDDDDASSNSSASVRSSNHNDNESPKSRIGQYRGKQYYIFDEEGLPYDPWFDLRSSKTLPLLKLLADEERLNALSKTTTGRAEIADLFIKNLPPLSNHFDRWKSVEQPKEVWMLLYHVRTLFRRLSPEQSAMYVPIYSWFKPLSDPEFQDLYAGPNWEIPSELKYIRPVTPPPAPKWPSSKPKSPMASSLKIAPAPLVVDSSSSREATPARAGPSVFGPSVRFPTPVGPQQRRPMPPVASPVPVARGKPMQGSKAAEVLEETSRRTSRRNVKQTPAPPDVKPKIAPAKGPSTQSKRALAPGGPLPKDMELASTWLAPRIALPSLQGGKFFDFGTPKYPILLKKQVDGIVFLCSAIHTISGLPPPHPILPIFPFHLNPPVIRLQFGFLALVAQLSARPAFECWPITCFVIWPLHPIHPTPAPCPHTPLLAHDTPLPARPLPARPLPARPLPARPLPCTPCSPLLGHPAPRAPAPPPCSLQTLLPAACTPCCRIVLVSPGLILLKSPRRRPVTTLNLLAYYPRVPRAYLISVTFHEHFYYLSRTITAVPQDSLNSLHTFGVEEKIAYISSRYLKRHDILL
ncbi:hypothetical protein B0H13DRAFT_1888769 [Mycena leptocephala]|nr:hypothetical protein B0H13DRAFT_1888769 [Mycena leptocephala]